MWNSDKCSAPWAGLETCFSPLHSSAVKALALEPFCGCKTDRKRFHRLEIVWTCNHHTVCKALEK